jgi:hypothetical protein
MSTNTVSTTKLVVIDTTLGIARSFEGNFECGEAHLPAEFDAADMTEQLNEFRLAADGARTRAQQVIAHNFEVGQRMKQLSTEYEQWFDVFHPEERDTFGL